VSQFCCVLIYSYDFGYNEITTKGKLALYIHELTFLTGAMMRLMTARECMNRTPLVLT